MDEVSVQVGILNEGNYRNTDKIGFTENDFRDTVDTYEFGLTQESEVNVTLDQLTQNANIEIVETETNTTLFQSTESGTRREIITEILEPGEYSVRVYAEGLDKTQYHIDLQAQEMRQEKDTIETAENLGILTPEEIVELDSIGFTRGLSRDTQDYYQFSLEAESDIFLTLDQLTRNADVEVFDSDGATLLFKSDNRGRSQEIINGTLEAGDYFIKVTPVGNARTDYRLGISAEVPGEPGDTPPGRNLGIVAPDNDIFQNDSIGRGQGNRRDTNDYYNFTVTSESQVILTLDNLRANADIELFNSDDEIIWRGDERGRRTEESIESLQPGNYTVRVFPQGNARTDYRLGITIPEVYIDDYPNPPEAFDFGVVTDDEVTKSGDVGRIFVSPSGRDEQDWFRFELSEQSDVDISLSQLRQNLDITLYDSDGETLLFDSKNSGRQQENINRPLTPGVYFVEVEPRGGARSDYQLTINAESLPRDPEIFNIGDLSQLEETYFNNDRIGFTRSGVRNESDRYLFSLSEEGRVDVTLDQMRANANLRLLDSQGSLMFDSRNPGRTTEEVGQQLQAGDYILEVFPQNAARTSYNLSVDFSRDPGEDDDDPPGQIIGELTELTEGYVRESQIGFSGWEDFRDQNDYHTFTLSEAQQVEIALDNLRVINSLT